MDLRPLLQDIRRPQDLMRLVAAWGHLPLWERLPRHPGHTRPRERTEPAVAGRCGEFPWLALESADAERAARSLARSWASRGRLCGVLALDPDTRRLAVALALDAVPTVSLDLDSPDPVALGCLGRLAGTAEGALAYAVRAAEALAGESAGRRFFDQFRATYERMAAGLPGPMRADDRRAYALLQLTRVLFLYFVQAKGWLDGRERFIAESVDRCLTRGRRLHRDLLRPLFFGTLNRAAAERSRAAAAFGAIPFLNGGLFEPHPIERRLSGDIPNDIWRDAFDGLFERFHFTVAEGVGDGRIAPDMLGRVFEGVMAREARRASGTYYTPTALVRRLVTASLTACLAHRLRCSEAQVEGRLAERHPEVLAELESLTILDPAVGSGAFLLGVLERIAGSDSARRRMVLQRNLFGVDRSAAAVRLTELRLWLAVIADDPAERPELVQPLPNLDCMVRQGDSLFEPVGDGIRLRPADPAIARELSQVRRQVIAASGRDKRSLVRRLTELETRATARSLAGAEEELAAAIDDLVRQGRSDDLFGARQGLDRAARGRLHQLRRELHAVRRARRTVVREREVPWFHYQCHFADVFARGGFDLVVGNPPWLRAEELPAETRRRLSGRYRWWRTGGRGYANPPDLAVAFLERALELTASGGVVAFLVPAKLATAGYGATARHALTASTTLLRVADLSGEPEAVFDATVYPLAVVIRKAAPRLGHRVVTGLTGKSGWVRQSRLAGGGPWLMARDSLRSALGRLSEAHPRLEERVSCHLGLKTGANRIFLDPPSSVEPELLRWAVRGRDVRPFRAASRTRLLYPHGADGRALRALPSRAAAYLASHSTALRARADYAGGAAWTLFRAGPATAPHRVIWPDLARDLVAAALTSPDDDPLVPLNSCYVTPMTTSSEAAALSAWLNSTWMRAAARATAVPAASGFARHNAATVGRLPLPASALGDSALIALAQAGRRGEPVQDDLDDLTARYLDLTASHRAALRRSLGRRAADHR